MDRISPSPYPLPYERIKHSRGTLSRRGRGNSGVTSPLTGEGRVGVVALLPHIRIHLK